MDISFAEPRFGWLRGQLTVGTERRPLLASWLSDTPRALVDAAVDVLEGRRADVVWVEEPTATRWLLEPEGRRLKLTVGACNGWTPVDQGTLVPGEDHTIATAEFGEAVLAAMVHAADTLGADRYASKDFWGHPFPADSVARLRRLVERGHTA